MLVINEDVSATAAQSTQKLFKQFQFFCLSAAVNKRASYLRNSKTKTAKSLSRIFKQYFTSKTVWHPPDLVQFYVKTTCHYYTNFKRIISLIICINARLTKKPQNEITYRFTNNPTL